MWREVAHNFKYLFQVDTYKGELRGFTYAKKNSLNWRRKEQYILLNLVGTIYTTVILIQNPGDTVD